MDLKKQIMVRGFKKIVGLIFIWGLFFIGVSPVCAAPLLANYYLGTVSLDASEVAKMAKNDVLILSPEQGIVRRPQIDEIKRQNPDIILLAYLPSESINADWQKYPANTLFKNFKMQDGWYLHSANGQKISNWTGLTSADMSHGWSDYLISFAKDQVLSQGIWDGIFWDMVYDGASWMNGGDVDLNSDGARDNSGELNAEWMRRVEYLLRASRDRLGVKYILINGTSRVDLQAIVNGRMYEDFPTSWEAGGSWSGIMNGLIRNQKQNVQPQLYVFNANTNNTGRQDDYKTMRFGLTSALMMDNIYFSFDYGTENHAQNWQYDEYGVNLGEPTGEAVSKNNSAKFSEDVWRRDYSRGVALVNPTEQSQEVDLGGDFEKIIGQQDPVVNTGEITNKVVVAAKDGLILLKTYQTIQSVVFGNGDFLRFFDFIGRRARNGFFAYEEGVAGGVKIYHGDLNGDGTNEKILINGPRLQIFNANGEFWFDDYPFGANIKGDLSVAVGKLYGGTQDQIAVAALGKNNIVLYNYHGGVIKEDFYPMGKKYNGSLAVAIGRVTAGSAGDLVVGVGQKVPAEILVFDKDLANIKKRFYPYGKGVKNALAIAVGDTTGNGLDEIITLPLNNKKPAVRVFSGTGKKISEFTFSSSFTGQTFNLGAVDVTYDGKKEIMVSSR